jgi:TPR repeat protein
MLKEANLGNTLAMFCCGLALNTDAAGSKDSKMAMYWFKKAGDLGHPCSMLNYAVGLQDGVLGHIDEKGSME